MAGRKVVCVSYISYAVSMAQYFVDALMRRDDDIEIFTIAPFFDNWIPWSGGITLPKRYVKQPTIPLPRNWLSSPVLFQSIEKQLPKHIDLFLEIDAGFHFANKPKADVVALIETDPHVLQNHYTSVEAYSDIVFGMQLPYLKANQVHLPYAVDDHWFYPEKREIIHDACLIGLHYPQRDQLVSTLRALGKNVYYDIGVVYDEYRHKYNESTVALSWSSLQDTPVRVFEALGMARSLVCNRTPDLVHFFKDGEHFMGFDNVSQAREATMFLLENPNKAEEIRLAGYKAIVDGLHTFDHRVQYLLEKCGVV